MPTLIDDANDYLSRDFSQLADTQLHCPFCGQQHSVPIGLMKVSPGLNQQAPAVARQILGREPRLACVVYDRAIQEIIEGRVLPTLSNQGFSFTTLPLGEKDSLLDSEINLADLASTQVDPRVDILIGAGSGVICDLTKWIATRIDRPYILCGTAPSMNAYTSITATITEGDIKISHLLRPADAVLLDTDILRDAPMEMIHSGIGDLSARAICNADWMLSHIILGTYFCPLPYQMTAENERLYLGSASGIPARDEKSIQLLSEAIMMSGLSMTILGSETSPSSGAEHVISHFWDLLHHVRGLPKNFHGAQVGVGTVIMLAFYEYMRQFDPTSIDPNAVVNNRPSLAALQVENNALYGSSAPMFNEVVQKKFLSDQGLYERITFVTNHWDEIWEELDPYAPSLDSIREPLRQAGVPLSLEAVKRTRAEAIEALVKGPQYRSRYTMLDLAWELGILPGAAEEILDRAGV